MIAFATLTGAESAAARQGGIESPIRIERCAVDSRTLLTDPFNSIRTNAVTGVSVRFVNARNVAATRVTLLLRYVGLTESIEATGTFAEGRAIDRTLTAFTAVDYSSAAADCRVASAVFADGTRWDAMR
jgi:hypothetical protein